MSDKIVLEINPDELTEDNDNEHLMLAVLMGKEIVYYFNNKLWVLCNDMFAWALADLEELPLTFEDITALWQMWYADQEWGHIKWCCIKRQEKPQNPVVEMMKKNGSWDDVMEALPENHYDAAWRKHREEQAKGVTVERGEGA
jgi:hypothetical protein